MQIIGSTIIFVSEPELYVKEKAGLKPNTVQYLTSEQESLLLAHRENIDEIVIKCSDWSDQFSRPLLDKTYTEVGGAKLWVFSWRTIRFNKLQDIHSPYTGMVKEWTNNIKPRPPREVHKKLIDLMRMQDINVLSLREIGRMMGVDHPQKVKCYIATLIRNRHINYENGRLTLPPP